MRSGTSIGANAEEAQDGQTKPDYITKMSVSRKESRETLYWLRLALRAKVVTNEEIAWELREAGELRAMIVAAIITAQSNQSRGRPQP
jgi:four helix bundle protein